MESCRKVGNGLVGVNTTLISQSVIPFGGVDWDKKVGRVALMSTSTKSLSCSCTLKMNVTREAMSIVLLEPRNKDMNEYI